MAGLLECTGPIEAFCQRADMPSSRRSLHSMDEIEVGDRVLLCFVGDDGKPPYSLKIRSPSGALMVDKIVRELPTGRPQSEPPVELLLLARGEYVIEIREVRGQSWGRAVLRIP